MLGFCYEKHQRITSVVYLVHRSIHHAVAEYLQTQGYNFTMSIFQPECGVSGLEVPLELEDQLRLLGIPEGNYVWEMVKSTEAQEGKIRLAQAKCLMCTAEDLKEHCSS